MSLPPHPIFLFQGFPGPVGDPGPKGSRVSAFWLVPPRWHMHRHHWALYGLMGDQGYERDWGLGLDNH